MSKNLVFPGYANYLINDKVYLPNLYTADNVHFNNLYCFLSGIIPWSNENSPPDITYSYFQQKTIFKNIFIIKKINSNDISPVIERIDWVTGTTYDWYDDTKNMFEKDENNKLVNQFYVRNSYDQVFKCLWNGSSIGVASTVEPKINYGYDISTIIKTADNYKWKYLFTINDTNKYNFFDNNWIPIPKQDHKFDLSTNTISAGSIIAINITDGGSSYTNDSIGGRTTNTIITGDGYNATAIATVSSNMINNYIITNAGYGYTYANITTTTSSTTLGSGATANTIISPIGGVGFDLLQELGCDTSVITCTFDETETSILPDNIDFRQIGLLLNPNIISGGYADGLIYNCSTTISVSPGTGFYQLDEIVYQGVDYNSSTFSANVVNFDSIHNILYVINSKGSYKTGLNLKGQSSGAVRQILTVEESEIVPYSGKILYMENRKAITRSSHGIEQFKLYLTH